MHVWQSGYFPWTSTKGLSTEKSKIKKNLKTGIWNSCRLSFLPELVITATNYRKKNAFWMGISFHFWPFVFH